jgi:hypothetical protein
MAYGIKTLADSMSPKGVRLTTLEVVFPRIVLSEFNTHRALSRNSASSRAIPIEKIIAKVMEDPFVPASFGKNQAGMQAEQELSLWEQEHAKGEWLHARDLAVQQARALLEIGVHKQLTNRLLEPFMWQTVLVSATEWSNFLALRCHKDAQAEIRTIAELMRDELATHQPEQLGNTDWHLPITPDFDELIQSKWIEDVKKISVGRCARVSYVTHLGVRDPDADVEMFNRLVASRHMSPLEHVAHPAIDSEKFYGNFRGWKQMRHYIPNEHDFGLVARS